MKKVSAVTLISCLLFCAFIIFSSLSPLADIEKNANQFNSVSMWLSIALILVLYLVPLSILRTNQKWMLPIMAILCAVGLLIYISAIIFVSIIGTISGNLPLFSIVLVVCALGLIVNLFWFFAAYGGRKSKANVSL